jgi:tRNA(Ile)-lysidine synthase
VALFNSQKLKRIFAALPGDAPFAVAVSGGGDSMALLHLVLNWRGSPHGLVALTVDHGLRADSAKETWQVKRWCNDLGVEHHTLKWRHDLITTGIQAKARKARYDLMAAWCAKHSITTLLTAHTAEDQAETVYMRLQRTNSKRSLAAIWPETKWNDLRVLRPLLNEQRNVLRAYLTGLRQEWIEDPSNDNEKFERVRIRRSAPAAALARQAAAAQRHVLAIEAKAHAWCETHLTIAASGMISFPPARYERQKREVADAILCRVIDLAGGTSPDAARRHRFIAWLQESAENPAQPRRTLGGALFAKRKRAVVAAREPARIDAKPVKLVAGKSVTWDRRFQVSGPAGSSIVLACDHNTLKSNDEIPAFIRAGWPLVMRRGKVLATPLAQFHPAAKITFIKK